MYFAILRGWFGATLQYGAKLLRHGEPGQPAENKDEKRHRTPETRVVTGCRVSVFAQLRYEALAACKTLASRPRAKQAGRAIDSAGKPVPNSACSCYLLL